MRIAGEYFVEPLIIDNTILDPPEPTNGLWENRLGSYLMFERPEVPVCSVFVLAYNRLGKTRYCVECILENTQDVDYELILVDNGSSDGTYDYFQSVPYKKKVVIRIEKNLGVSYPNQFVKKVYRGKYWVNVMNDVYVTKNWLSNLLRVYQSDPRIGMAVPVSSNVSNLQEVDLGFASFLEMQRKAAEYNRSDPAKWEERLRLMSVIIMLPRDVMDIVGLYDPAFVHDFSEDDLAMRLRRSGYRLILCRDTYVCHDHDFRNMENKDPEEYRRVLESGREIFKEKYHGLDAWDDVLNFELSLFAPLDRHPLPREGVRALSVDSKCGTPVLEIRNRLRRRDIHGVESYAFTSRAEYFADLQTVAREVRCDRIEFIQEYYANDSFDIISLGDPVNVYSSPITLLQKLMGFLRPGGALFFKLRNTSGVNQMLDCLGLGGTQDSDLPAILPRGEVDTCLRLIGTASVQAAEELFPIGENDLRIISDLLRRARGDNDQESLRRSLVRDYLYCAVKG